MLLRRETRVLRSLILVRGFFIFLLLLTTLVVAFSNFERIATAAVSAAYLAVLFVCWRLLARPDQHTLVGLLGALLDVLVILLLPAIWYYSVGGAEVQPAYMLKTELGPIALLLIIINSLAMRALYPLLVTAGTLIVYLVYYTYIVADPRTVISGDYVLAVMGPHLHTGLLSGTLVTIVGSGCILSFLAWSARKTIFRASRLESANARLERYFSPNLVRRLAENPDLLKLGGERRTLSFVFTDLAGFTALTEQLEPRVMVQLLNDYLEGMIGIAFRYEGTIDKVVGDAVHVIFGAPVAQEDHASRALDCALAMDSFARKFAAAQRDQGISLGDTRLGVNTGQVTVGNFGGRQMFDYTAHGDAINVAARLEALNKHTGTRLAISAQTVEHGNTFRVRPMGEFKLKGKSEWLTVFEGLHADHPSEAYLEQYRQAYALLDASVERSRRAFAELARSDDKDPLVRFYCDRLSRGQAGKRMDLSE